MLTDRQFDKSWKIKTCPKCKVVRVHVFQQMCSSCFQAMYEKFQKQNKNEA